MSRLVITDLHATVAGKEILHGISLEVGPGEIHAVMGPNGSGKSTLAHAIMGRPGTTVTSGSIALDGDELVGRPTHERARAGLFLALQQLLDEIDSGLDVDALAAIGKHLSAASKDADRQLSVLAITHFRRLLDVLTPDRIHVLVSGELVDSGGPELVTTLEAEGYARYKVTTPSTASAADPFGF